MRVDGSSLARTSSWLIRESAIGGTYLHVGKMKYGDLAEVLRAMDSRARQYAELGWQPRESAQLPPARESASDSG